MLNPPPDLVDEMLDCEKPSRFSAYTGSERRRESGRRPAPINQVG